MLAGCGSAATTTTPGVNASATPTQVAWPSAMDNPTAAWDPASGLTLVAGDAGGRNIELWGWDGSAWTQLDDGRGTAPSARDDIHLVADPSRGVVWLHGGRGGGGTARNDTWRWDGESWTEAVPNDADGAPPARTHPVMGWDPASERVLLQGGIDASESFLRDTWAWDGAHWILRPGRSPAGRWASVQMAYDPTRDAVAILVVDLEAPDEDDLYEGRLLYRDAVGRWRAIEAAGPRFSPIQPMVATDEELVLVDGGGLQGQVATWAWDGGAWTRVASGGPEPRNGQALAYDAARDRVVMFGGSDGARELTDIWEWDGSAWERKGPAA